MLRINSISKIAFNVLSSLNKYSFHVNKAIFDPSKHINNQKRMHNMYVDIYDYGQYPEVIRIGSIPSRAYEP